MTYMLVGINPTKANELKHYLTPTDIILLLQKSLNIDINRSAIEQMFQDNNLRKIFETRFAFQFIQNRNNVHNIHYISK